MSAARELRHLNDGAAEWLPLKKLTIDERIQRPLNKTWVDREAERFNPDAFGTLIVSRRKDGRYIVLDGQHRAALMDHLGYGDQLVPCTVLTGLSFEEEARLFNVLNVQRRAVQYIDRFRNDVNAKDPVALAVRDIAKEFTLTIGRGTADRNIQAALALVKVYEGDKGAGSGRNPIALRRTLMTLKAAWGDGWETWNGSVIEGVGLCFLRYDNAIDPAELATKLAKQGSIAKLLGRARDWKAVHGRGIATAVAAVVTDLYNVGRRTSKLEGWLAA